MLAILNDTIFDSRTPFEKQLDRFIEERNKPKRLNNIKTSNKYYLLLPMISLPSGVSDNIETISNFCKGVSKFFSTIWFILCNIPTISHWVCLILTLCGFMLYILFDIKKGKEVAVISTTTYIFIRMIAYCLR